MYHLSVLLEECLEGLKIKPNGIYVDTTFGGGGHSRAILSKLNSDGRLIAFDQDIDAFANTIDDPRFKLVHANFENLEKHLRVLGIKEVDGILADLGVSSHQFDTSTRGFSIRFDGPLDMRMNTLSNLTAADVLNTYSEEGLVTIFSLYGEVPNSKRLANAIVNARVNAAFKTTSHFLQFINEFVMGERHKYQAQVFQALRIEVNNELGALEALLVSSANVLAGDGRLVVLTFHSLEDRLVKQYMKNGVFDDEPVKDEFGRTNKPLSLVNKKPIVASIQELKQNTRSRSAKLRVAFRNKKND